MLGKREESAWEENKKVISISFDKVPHQRQRSPLITQIQPIKIAKSTHQCRGGYNEGLSESFDPHTTSWLDAHDSPPRMRKV